MVVSKVLKMFKKPSADGILAVRIKRTHRFNARIQRTLERKAMTAGGGGGSRTGRGRRRAEDTTTTTRTTFRYGGGGGGGGGGGSGSGGGTTTSTNMEEKRKHELHEQKMKQKKRARKPRFGEQYRVKLEQTSSGLGLRFTTKAEDGTSSNTNLVLVVTQIVSHSIAARLGDIQLGDVLLSFKGYVMAHQTHPMRAMRQLASTTPKGTMIDMVFQCMGGTGSGEESGESTSSGGGRNARTRKNSKEERFGRTTEKSGLRQRTIRPDSITCEISAPLSLAAMFGRSSASGARNELICAGQFVGSLSVSFFSTMSPLIPSTNLLDQFLILLCSLFVCCSSCTNITQVPSLVHLFLMVLVLSITSSWRPQQMVANL